ncbi:MAG TPA: hypothetical protein VKA48_12615, partial [Gammaproteobacteria bacterium]|nr:hypothetical protein [Gammaproteobacteria bacterium]
MSHGLPNRTAILLTCAGLAAFIGSVGHWAARGPEGRAFDTHLQVVLPAPAGLAMAFGDRYLAADLATTRALVAATDLQGNAEKALFARLLEEALTLN